MLQVLLVHNNNGLFRQKKSSSSPLSIHYRSQTARLKHRRIKRKVLDGAGDLPCTPSPSINSKQIDFSELEQIFDTAIRNRLPIDLYKDEAPTRTQVISMRDESVQYSSPTATIDRVASVPFQYPRSETRLNLTFPPLNDSHRWTLTGSFRKHRILTALTLVTLAALLGFFTVFIFFK